MLKQRVIFVVVGIVLVVILYNLPKIVVDNDPEARLEGTERAAMSANGGNSINEMKDPHDFEIPPEVQARLVSYRTEFNEESNPDRVGVADSLAFIYLTYNKYDSAAKYLEYIAINKPSIDHFQNAGNAFYEAFSFAMDRGIAMELAEKARYYYNLILDEQPNRFDLRNKIAMSYISSANPMQGIMILRQILEEDPENEMAIFNLGTLSVQSGQYEKARDYFENLVGINPKNAQAQFYLGLSYYNLNQKDKARKQFELVKGMEEDPAVIATVEGYLRELN
jgi:tetratricopeptide (TPR) repeat protein